MTATEPGLAPQGHHLAGYSDPGASRTIHLAGLTCVVRIGRFGAYLESKRVSDDGEEEWIKARLPREITPADLDEEQAELISK